MLRICAAIFLFLLLNGSIQAQDKPEPIPAPKTTIEPLYQIVPVTPRLDTRDVWQHYAVGPLGRFVPRVIVTPYGPLTSRDLQPYPWIQNRRTAVMPYAVN